MLANASPSRAGAPDHCSLLCDGDVEVVAINPLRLVRDLARDLTLCPRFNLWFLAAFGK